MLLTTQQVKEQQQSFDCFIKSVNLSKIGKIIIKHISAGDSLHYEFVRKVLYNAKIRPAMYHPTLTDFTVTF